MSESAAVVVQESNLVVATYGPIVACAVDGLTLVPQMDTLATALKAAARANPEGIILVFVVRQTSLLPTTEVRARFAATLAAMQSQVKLLAAVIEGAGFGASAKRSVFTMVINHMIGKITLKVLADCSDAVAWVAAEGTRRGLRLAPETAIAKFMANLPATVPTGA
jgi:hypothetical protein